MAVADLLMTLAEHGVTLTVKPGGGLTATGDEATIARHRQEIREYKTELLALLSVPEPHIQAEAFDLREHFEERAAILEHDANIPSTQAELEAAQATCVLARNRGYSWAALRLVFTGFPAILEALPDQPGVVDHLPLGYARLAVFRGKVVPQGAHRVEWEKSACPDQG